MGTSYSVQIAQALVTPEQQQVEQTIALILAEVEQTMSTYRQDSELSLINATDAGGEPITLSAPMFEVLQLAAQIHRQSDGAFDITIGPLVDLWGFGAAEREEEGIPSIEAVDTARAKLGATSLILNGAALSVLKTKRVRIDLSAIAKGYAVDLLSRRLFKLGLSNHLVEVGGELRAAGINARSKAWTVGIEVPSLQRGQPYSAVQLRQKAIATSGDYRNFFEYKGQRYSHTIDPRTARPVTHHLASVSVVHDSSAAADAWATALSVLGPQQGYALAEREQLAAFFIERNEQGFVAKETPAFSAYNNVAPADAPTAKAPKEK